MTWEAALRAALDSRFRGNDEWVSNHGFRFFDSAALRSE